MSELSWIIYLAGVSGGLSVVAAGVSIAAFVVGYFAAVDASNCYIDQRHKPLAVVKAAAAAFSVSLLLAVLLPSRETVFAIAAVEFGSDYVASPDGKRVTGKAAQALEAWLDRQIEEKNDE